MEREPLLCGQALDAFPRETGFVAQPVSRWNGRDEAILVCFIPADRLDRAAAAAEALNDHVRSAPSRRPA